MEADFKEHTPIAPHLFLCLTVSLAYEDIVTVRDQTGFSINRYQFDERQHNKLYIDRQSHLAIDVSAME
ncbi:hypothetical protein Dpoa2040_001857 [Dickeya sp. CFBP 2040]|uniref:hypothetical protein n=1 Tax=Dickeya poaceiphila TaxID=568768 RepID=UPI0005B4C422|nr:hypothetical protein [Dickeya poaceiphila]NKI74588.1 hypothetical protein [Dickeya sp. CFBP 2040]